jgi:hypothetical protein
MCAVRCTARANTGVMCLREVGQIIPNVCVCVCVCACGYARFDEEQNVFTAPVVVITFSGVLF